MKTFADQYVEKIITETASLKTDEVDKLSDRIRVRRQALVLSSSSRVEILGISKQILAFGGAGLAAALATANNIRNAGATVQSILALVGILYLELMIVSLVVLIIYMLQARYRYPSLFLEKIGNAWPFFYYASISNDVPRAELPTGRQQFTGACLYSTRLRAIRPSQSFRNASFSASGPSCSNTFSLCRTKVIRTNFRFI